MALPPLELFSLKKRPPCCRVASSLSGYNFWVIQSPKNSPKREAPAKIYLRVAKPDEMLPMQRYEERYEVLRRKRHSMSNALPTALQVTIALLFLAILILPNIFANDTELDEDDRNRNHIP